MYFDRRQSFRLVGLENCSALDQALVKFFHQLRIFGGHLAQHDKEKDDEKKCCKKFSGFTHLAKYRDKFRKTVSIAGIIAPEFSR